VIPAVPERTLASSFEIAGRGLHGGLAVRLTALPAAPGTGVSFIRTDDPSMPALTVADADPSSPAGRTALARDGVSVETVEHFLAAASALGLDNARVELDGPEVPALDGSALPFVEAISRAGLVEQPRPREGYVVTEPVVVEDGDARLVAVPLRPDGSRLTELSYVLCHEGNPLACGRMEIALTPEAFVRELAPARTFCLAADVERLRASGLGKGADHSNTVVVDGSRSQGGELRFPDEPVRHKLLDLAGDLALLGAPVVGRIMGFRSGHALNRGLVARLRRACPRRGLDSPLPRPALRFEDVLSVLPHRYPFLLIDRVLEIEEEKRIAAAKAVSGNEAFFRGHFPGNPVMPGVLQIEALAQAAGVLLSKYMRVGGKMAALAGVDGVRFRRPVVPGDMLRLDVKLKKLRRTLCVCECAATVGGDVASEATLLFGLIGAGGTWGP
jgi:UDP-3-O-[3-hydroxymyristoyl] N-acetylglucosamine deacetylase/3-hydroxyacyl-[acyl-carrier-protein] dehydratase